MQTKFLTYTAFLVCIATILSFIVFTKLPFGGSITAFSMLPIVLIGYYFGPKIGLLGSFVYGLLQLIFNGYFFSIPQVIIDYVFAFTSLSFGSFITMKSPYRLPIVYTVGVLFRYIFACISGYIFFAEYVTEGLTLIEYTLLYNASYILPEYILTIILISTPLFKKTINKLNYF